MNKTKLMNKTETIQTIDEFLEESERELGWAVLPNASPSHLAEGLRLFVRAQRMMREETQRD